ncbi:MAG: hypothetical protein ABF780_07265 [Bifidobacterium aquikefiri]|uniref:ATP-grasp domain-containing protein n=1 Tax=Bifidobacterium aquikefiri TaxID=1653207 RepID=A0A261G8I0_9BIFI|nr:hypothetical protein [Bifidobacterium aquikefiri]OZG67728.1 hypothetical protein BAQU_0372 [Bifidobacterium aquikefiri]
MTGLAENYQSTQSISHGHTFHIVADLQWIWDSFQGGAEQLSAQWQFKHDLGLWPIPHLDDKDALWIDPASLVANNAWLERQGQPPITLLAPPQDWIGGLSRLFLGREVVLRSVAEILDMDEFGDELGDRPWSQPNEGRISGFRAARRTLSQLKHDLRGNTDHQSPRDSALASADPTSPAPLDSVLMLHGHLDGITEEWMVAALDGKAFAASPYCIHCGNPSRGSTDSEEIVTIFDLRDHSCSEDIHFDERHHQEALGIVADALEQTHASNDFAGMLNIAFRDKKPPAILEISPLWCSGPYGFSAQELAMILKAIASSRIPPSASGQEGSRSIPCPDVSRAVTAMKVFKPGRWMIEHYAQRYIR